MASSRRYLFKINFTEPILTYKDYFLQKPWSWELVYFLSLYNKEMTTKVQFCSEIEYQSCWNLYQFRRTNYYLHTNIISSRNFSH